jgi:UDP-N-acetylglucosamine 4,6-dehydratase
MKDTILILGGTGTIGSSVVEKLIPTMNVIVVSRSEEKQMFLRKRFPDVTFFIGDIKNKFFIKQIIKNYTPKYVLNCSAMKHVRICEENPLEAILTNVIGEQNILEAVEQYDGVTYISISTDKVVNGVSTYGMTKSLQEKIHLANPNNKKNIYNCVRLGNIYGSSGSVVPIFKKQIEANQNLKLTHKDMTRFFMKQEQAADFIVKCFDFKSSGKIFIPKLKSFRIYDLAKSFIASSGKDLQIEVATSTNETLSESLFSLDESLKIEELDSYFALTPNQNPSDDQKYTYNSSDEELMMTEDEFDKFING